MNTRIIVPAILGALALGTPLALAGVDGPNQPQAQANVQHTVTNPAADKCTRFESLFDVELKNQHRTANEAESKSLRAEGGALCAAKEYDLGSAKLQMALQGILGFTPEM